MIHDIIRNLRETNPEDLYPMFRVLKPLAQCYEPCKNFLLKQPPRRFLCLSQLPTLLTCPWITKPCSREPVCTVAVAINPLNPEPAAKESASHVRQQRDMLHILCRGRPADQCRARGLIIYEGQTVSVHKILRTIPKRRQRGEGFARKDQGVLDVEPSQQILR